MTTKIEFEDKASYWKQHISTWQLSGQTQQAYCKANEWTPYAELYHHESASRGLEDTPEKQARFEREEEYMQKCWGDQLLNDPAYSPNLTLDHENFSLAWPPRVELVSPPFPAGHPENCTQPGRQGLCHD